ncbi:2'-phosphotransferase [Sporothrix schenckii 1099-18]|uniref:2'-phosphotransferase n=1 Tax=Sporothrix schenckii 1099-18 TaxID=1397361 RepID=A0A0F2MBE3_SPOSC|nr:2'-phosphotransferase [Sporothrix schenckii 1099-18]KJR86419.1 2'-phosphotransferase [Sporothrix schenckii 1099-18]
MDDFDNAEALAAQFHDRLGGIGGGGGNRRGGRGGRGGGGRRGGGGGGGGGRSVDISRALSRLLRHQAANAGIPLDPEGFAPLDRVLQWGPLRSLNVTLAEVRDVVLTNEKQRFALKRADADDVDGVDDVDDALDLHTIHDTDSPAAYRIRANQGHSIATVTSDAGLLTPIDDPETAPPVVCHGTFFAFWLAIEATGGLRRMTRNHVHCGCLESGQTGAESVEAARRAGAVIPGLRRDAQVLVFLDVRRALRQDPGLKWWRAANGVVLTEGDADGKVPAKYFQRVVTSREGARLLPPPATGDAGSTVNELVLWEDGEKVADLPAETLAKARVPHGKQGLQKRADAAAGAGGSRGAANNKQDQGKGASGVE